MPSPLPCAGVLGWDKPKLAQAERDDHRRRFVQSLCRIEPAVAAARSLVHQFIGLVRRRDLDGFDRWMLQATTCMVQDATLRGWPPSRPVGGACRLQLAVEQRPGRGGQLNRVKYLKRQMYGRAKLDLMRIRVLHPN